MPTPYYDMILKTVQAEGEINQLQYDIQNSSTALALREVMIRLFNVTTTLLYHCVSLTEELVRLNVLQRRAPLQVPAAAPAAQPLNYPIPNLPTIPRPNLSPPAAGAGITDVPPCDVAQVVITPTGTRVIPPAGAGIAPVVLPPNAPVHLEQMQAPPAPPPAPPGVSQVVLPQGGALSPELQAALAARQGTPPGPTGG